MKWEYMSKGVLEHRNRKERVSRSVVDQEDVKRFSEASNICQKSDFRMGGGLPPERASVSEMRFSFEAREGGRENRVRSGKKNDENAILYRFSKDGKSPRSIRELGRPGQTVSAEAPWFISSFRTNASRKTEVRCTGTLSAGTAVCIRHPKINRGDRKRKDEVGSSVLLARSPVPTT